ncbi:MAG: ROK family protein [Bacteroidales bacterium]|jgi:glucokinase|nr:ROK family protein [Bacteroidales bacterium]
MSQSILGIDIGGTKCAVILGEVKESGLVELRRKKTFPTETSKGFEHTIQNIYKNIDDVLSESGLAPKDIAACGVSCGGPLDSKKGIVMSPPNLPGWDNIPLVELLENRYGIKTGVQNDANACALAEWKYGAARGYNHAVFLTFGTGMGAGLILDGRLYVGANDMAGEVGHIRLERFGPVGYGKAGSFEGFCSGGGLAQLAQTKTYEKFQMGEQVSFCKNLNEIHSINAKMLADVAFAGDETALEIFEICGHYLGHALSILIDILNPEMIVLGSIYARAQQLIEPSMRKIIETETIPYSRNVCKIEPAELGENIGDYAALSVATYQLKKDAQ